MNKSGEKFDINLMRNLLLKRKNVSKEKTEKFRYLNYHTYSKKNGAIYRYSDKIRIVVIN